jgi:hypothetical protein
LILDRRDYLADCEIESDFIFRMRSSLVFVVNVRMIVLMGVPVLMSAWASLVMVVVLPVPGPAMVRTTAGGLPEE